MKEITEPIIRIATITSALPDEARLGSSGLYSATSWLAKNLYRSDAKVYEVCIGAGGLKEATYITPMCAAKMIANGEIIAIYTQYIHPLIPLELAGNAYPSAVPILSIGHDFVNSMPSVFSWINSPSRHSSDVVVVSSHAGARVLREMLRVCDDARHPPKVDIEVIPLGIDEDEFHSIADPIPVDGDSSNNRVSFLWFGRFSESYKADLRPALMAIDHLLRNERSFEPELIAAGADQGGYCRKLRSYANELGIADNCRWYPNVDTETRRALFAEADVLLNVSEHVQETFGLVNLEAMASGVPVIASDWSGFREIIKNGRTGLLVPTILNHDLLSVVNLDVHGGFSISTAIDMDSLLKAMTVLGKNRGLRISMGIEGRKLYESSYSSSVLIPKYVELIKRRASIAFRSQPRCTARKWMPRAFGEYATVLLDEPVRLSKGLIPLKTALRVTDNEVLCGEMINCMKEIEDKVGSTSASAEIARGGLMRQCAILNMLKLGVTKITVDANQLNQDDNSLRNLKPGEL